MRDRHSEWTTLGQDIDLGEEISEGAEGWED